MESGSSTRWLNIAVGVWLFISAFIWAHSYAQFTNTWIIGIACVVLAAIAMRVEQIRYLTAALAIWLFISSWALPTHMAGTVWNNILSSIAMFVIALAPDQHAPGAHRTMTSGAR